MITYPIIIAVLVILYLLNAIKVLREYERGVVFRLGRFAGVKGPGLKFIIPVIDRLVKVSLRTVAMDVPPQDIITKDNVSVKVNAVLYGSSSVLFRQWVDGHDLKGVIGNFRCQLLNIWSYLNYSV